MRPISLKEDEEENENNQLVQSAESRFIGGENMGFTSAIPITIMNLFDEVLKLHINHAFFYFLQYSIPILQMFGVSLMFPNSNDNLENDDGNIIQQIISGIYCLVKLAPHSFPDFGFYLVGYLIVVIYNIFAFTSLLTILFVYKNSAKISKFWLYFCSFILQISSYVFFLPSWHIITTSIHRLQNFSAIAIIEFVFAFISLLIACFILYLTTSVINYSTCPNRSPFATFDGRHTRMMLFFYGVSILVTGFIPFFIWVFRFFIIFARAVLYAILIYDTYTFPFLNILPNALPCAFYSLSIGACFISFVSGFKNVPYFVPLLFPMMCLVIFSFVHSLIMKSISKKVVKVLEDPRIFDESQRDEYLSSLKLSETKATRNVRIGFCNLCVSIYSSAFTFYFATKFQSIEFWKLTTAIISFFPNESINFTFALNELRARYPRHFVDKLRVAYFLKVQQFRFLTSQTDVQRRLMKVTTMNDDAIYSIKSFWSDVSKKNACDTHILYTLAATIVNTKAVWKETINLYPNEFRFALEYSRFLIECLGKFEEGIIWKLKSEHLEKGFQAGIDPLFRSFVVSYPQVFKAKIVDKHGNLLKTGREDDSTANGTTSTFTSTNALEKIESDIEMGKIEQMMTEMFLWPNLRSQLYKATSHFTIKRLRIFRFLKYIAFALMIVIILYTFDVFPTAIMDYNMIYTRIRKLTDLRTSYSFARTALLMKVAGDMGKMYTETEYENIFGKTNHTVAMKPNDPLKNLDEWTIFGVESFLDMFRSFTGKNLDGESIATVIEPFITDTVCRTYCLGIKSFLSFTTVNATAKEAMVAQIWAQQSLNDIPVTDILQNEQFCEYNLMSTTFPETLDSIGVELTQQVDQIDSSTQSTIKNVVILVELYSILILLPLIVIPQFIIRQEYNRYFNALKAVDPAGAKQATKLLTIENEDKPVTGSKEHIHSYETTLFVWNLIYGFIYLVIVVLIGMTFFYSSSRCSSIMHTIQIYHYGITTNSQIGELLSLCAFHVFNSQIPIPYYRKEEVGQEYNWTVQTLITYQNNYLTGEYGMSVINPEISDLHLIDNCPTDHTKVNKHDQFQCLGVQSSIEYIANMAGDIINNSNITFSSEDFLYMFHFSTDDLYMKLNESRKLCEDMIKSDFNDGRSLTIVINFLTLLFVVIELLIDIMYYTIQKRVIKVAFVIMRHLTPPVVAETQEIVDILLVQKRLAKTKMNNVHETAFNSISKPILYVGEGNIIETINAPFSEAFKIKTDQIVGHNLTQIIPLPYNEQANLTIEEQGATHLYEKMRLGYRGEYEEKSMSYLTCVTIDENNTFSAQITAYPVRNKTNRIIGFVLFIEDKRSITETENKLADAKNEVTKMIEYLIPKKVSEKISENKDYSSFLVEQVVIVAVQINVANEMLKNSPKDFEKTLTFIEQAAKNHPPFISLHTLYDTIYLIGGIYKENPIDELVRTASVLATVIQDTIHNTLPNKANQAKRYTILIHIGGPVLTDVVDNVHFDVYGSILNSIFYYVSSIPDECISITKEAKDAAGEDNIAVVQAGVQIEDMQTFIL